MLRLLDGGDEQSNPENEKYVTLSLYKSSDSSCQYLFPCRHNIDMEYEQIRRINCEWRSNRFGNATDLNGVHACVVVGLSIVSNDVFLSGMGGW